MAVKYAAARKFALSLPGVSEEPHFGRPSFRVNKRILMTVPSDVALNLFVADAERDACLTVYEDCTEKVFWGGKVVGIRLLLPKATRGAMEDLVLRAWKYRAGKKALAACAGTATPVDAYIAGFPPEIRERLDQVRAAIRRAAPDAVETISYRIPAYKLDGTLIYFAGFAQHIGLYPAPRGSAEFKDELSAYEGGKGTVQFPHDRPLPLDLVRRIVKFRAATNRAQAQTRKTAKTRKPPTARKATPKQVVKKAPRSNSGKPAATRVR